MGLLSFACQHRVSREFCLDLAFEVEDRFTALFGPSGSGKTTALAMIAGFVRPHAGRIVLGDRVLFDKARGVCLPPERRGVGMVYQDALLFPHLTVEGNLRYGQRHRSRPTRSINFACLIEVLEIGSLLERYPRHLSGGERQRVAIGRTILSGPEILLMDEPLASLDAAMKLKVLTYLERIVAEWDLPTVFVTHAQAEVRRVAQGVIVIDKGRLVATGTPEDALSRPEPLEWGNSTGPVNLIRVDAVRLAGSHLVAQVGRHHLFVPTSEVPSSPTTFVQFSPRDVILSREDMEGLSARNRLRGRICRVIETEHAVFVAVDVGAVVWAEITADATAELKLHEGEEITCVMKAHNLRIVS